MMRLPGSRLRLVFNILVDTPRSARVSCGMPVMPGRGGDKSRSCAIRILSSALFGLEETSNEGMYI